MNKVLLIISEYPELKDILSQVREVEKREAEAKLFLHKAIDAHKERFQAEEKIITEQLLAFLKSKGKLPEDFSSEAYDLNADTEGDCIFLHKHDESCNHKSSFIKAIMDVIKT